MYLTKYPNTANYAFAQEHDPDSGALSPPAGGEITAAITRYGEDVFLLELSGRDWGATPARVGLTPPPLPSEAGAAGSGQTELVIGDDADLNWRTTDGTVLLSSSVEGGIGLCGTSAMFRFQAPEGLRWYGLGEQPSGLEKSGVRTKFWNSDVWSDHPFAVHEANEAHPMYVSIPYVIVRTGTTYLGLLLDNPAETFAYLTDDQQANGHVVGGPGAFSLGSAAGAPRLYLIYGPTLADLTGKLQRLVGTTPLPPLWALGNHQSRWGYRGDADLTELDRRFDELDIPADGLWLDIDYMSDFRVFTVNEEHLPHWQGTLARLRAAGRRVVPIIDPGIGREPGWPIYDDALAEGVLCLNDEGLPYVGIAWPGLTVFPDFSMPRTRQWWAEQVTEFAGDGLDGVWIDMNDPSTGSADPTGMRFADGALPHWAYRNDYALGMAEATRAGLLAANPERRPFVLSRSGSTGSSRYSAIWTGDNHANEAWLRGCIPASLNLALSGVPFNAPDIGGFGGNTTERIYTLWQKACFLFPFHRNHTCIGTSPQEPWAFCDATTSVARHYIQQRYRFLPYLYQLFINQEASGEAILRPLMYEFDDEEYAEVDDQFLVGPALLQAPQVRDKTGREVLIPPGRWFDYSTGQWLTGPDRRWQQDSPATTCLLGRAGHILPLRPGPWADNRTDLRQVELHVLLPANTPGEAQLSYRADDGETFGYQAGQRSVLQVTARTDHARLRIELTSAAAGFGPIQATAVLYDHFEQVELVQDGMQVGAVQDRYETDFAGTPITLTRLRLAH